MCCDIAVEITRLGKCYEIYEKPQDRLKQCIYPRLKSVFGRESRDYFREFWALRDVSFNVYKGETVGIIGQNGSGKSTLLQIVCNTLSPTCGATRTNGRVAALLELGAGFNPEFTGRENVYMNGTVLGLDMKEIQSRFPQIMAFADIGDFIEQPVKTYSSGMLVRLAFAVAINVDPQILVVDEALSVGDEVFQRKCFARIEAIKKQGATILFVSHSGSAVVELCDRTILLDRGELLAEGIPKQIVGAYQKLMYAPVEKRDGIRAGIRSSYQSGVGDSSKKIKPSASETALPKACLQPDADQDELYDPELKPQSLLSYESRGVHIEDPEILTVSGKRVNCLKRGETYRYCYTVRFEQGAANVRFGMLIKTLSGLELGGSVSAAGLEDAIAYQESGSLLRVEFRFVCDLNPGVYFLNAGVTGLVQGEDTYLHRVLDLCMFKVLPVVRNSATGIVDFRCHVSIHASR
jgi:lipopolysaccharide transport system ATP-binding protein